MGSSKHKKEKKKSRHHSPSPEHEARKREKKEKRREEKQNEVRREERREEGASGEGGAFVWHKKHKEDGIDQLSEQDKDLLAKMKEKEKKVELWKVQRRREERELELAARADELDRVRGEKEVEMFKEWKDQEGKFHLTQARLRSELRIKNNRANPIDLLAYYIHNIDNSTSEVLGDPISVLDVGRTEDIPVSRTTVRRGTVISGVRKQSPGQGIKVQDLEDLQADIKVYTDMDKTKVEQLFWTDMAVIVAHTLKQNKEQEKVKPGRSSINSAVNVDVSKIFKGKTSNQLREMHAGIKKKLSAGGPIDVPYWESVAEQVMVEVSKVRIREKHDAVIKMKEFSVKSEAATAGEEAEPLFPVTEIKEEEEVEEEIKEETKEKKKLKKLTIPVKDEDSHIEKLQEYEDMCYTPIRLDSIETDAKVWTDRRVEKEIREMREEVMALISSGNINTSPQSLEPTTKAELEAQAHALMGAAEEDEDNFNTDFDLDDKTYTWADKHRPRKPRFYNRVHTGYEWNKYNQTHYDQDNPPPKIVQGYKFNIFFQDLLDPSQTPQFSLKPCEDDKEFGILRFSSGPPYEDIAFKVLNKEWEYSHRHQFKSQFSQGIFQLWFQFKKYRYRR